MAVKKEELQAVRQRRYVGRDFDGLKAQLREYVRLYNPNVVKDLTENGLAGMLLDFAAGVGDNMSFYLDHQYGELDATTAIEQTNIERALRRSGVPIVGAAPSNVPVTFFVRVPATSDSNGDVIPATSSLPIIQRGTVCVSNRGIKFNLVENVDFTETDDDGKLIASVRIATRDSSNVPTSFILARVGTCVSGTETTETFTIGSFEAFRRIQLTNSNVTEIISVTDSFGNIYYKVNSLAEDVVYTNVTNTNNDASDVSDALWLVPAPYRFIVEVDVGTRKSTMIFGGGSATTLDDDIIPDPTDFAISLPYKQTFTRNSINPQSLLSTKTLGVAASDTVYTVTYRHGGGRNHNVPAGTIININTLLMQFPNNPSSAVAAQVRASVEITNNVDAKDGDDAPSIDDLKQLIPAAKNSQERIVTNQDVLARVYSLPSNFGRVYRAVVRSNPNNPLSRQLFITSIDSNNQLTTSSDTLKKNLAKYLNPYRNISDAIDILDARIIDLSLTFDVIIDPNLNQQTVLQSVLKRLLKTFSYKTVNIDQPIVLSQVSTTISLTPGVIAVPNVKFDTITGTITGRTYSNETFDVGSNIVKGMLLPPVGGIFQIRYPQFDIVGKVA